MKNGDFLKDINLWKRLLQGDRKALSVLFEKYYKLLLNYGLRLVADKELVKDSIQELFYTIWEKREQLSEVEYVRSYLYSSMRRTVFRQAEIQQTRHERDRSYSAGINTAAMNQEQLMILEEFQQEERENLKEAIESLSDRQKEAAFLKFYSGLTNDEISEVMGVNKQSVYNHIYRAIEALQKNMSVSLTG